MRKVYGIPTLESSLQHANNGISQAIIGLGKSLPTYGYEMISKPSGYDISCYHAGEGGKNLVDVAVCHGLHPTGYSELNPGEVLFEINARVIRDMTIAKEVIAPSEWVAEILRRDMKLTPHVVQWGIDLDLWGKPEAHQQYVLWNKNRADPVCNPDIMNAVAAKLPHVRFLSTFGKPSQNVTIIGRQLFSKMVQFVKHAGVYLATTRETGDIGSREALACGVPVVGFNWGATPDFVFHGVNGFLAAPGDIDGLAAGIEYAIANREVLSSNAVILARGYSWNETAQKFAAIFDTVIEGKQNLSPKVSVVIPCYNYAQYIGDAIKSVLSQQTDFDFEVIVVDDGSTDNSLAIAQDIARTDARLKVFQVQNGGVAKARSFGASKATGEYIAFLDADDQMGQGFLKTCVQALDKDPMLGLAYADLRLINGGQTGFPPKVFDPNLHLQGKNQVPTLAMMRSADFNRIGGYRTYMQPAEDADLFARLIVYTGKKAAMVTDEPLFIYNNHPDSLSGNYRQQHGADPFVRRGEIFRRRPIAAPRHNGVTLPSNPCVYYDIPLIKVVIVSGSAQDYIQKTLDSLDQQDYPFWTTTGKAPLEVRVQSGQWLAHDWLSVLLQKTDLSKISSEFAEYGVIYMGCCGRVTYSSVNAHENDADFVLVQFLGGGDGKIWVGSPTGKKFRPGIPTSKTYDRRKKGDIFRVHKDDAKAAPHLFKALPTHVDLKPQEETVIPPVPQPLPPQEDGEIVIPKAAPPIVQDEDEQQTEPVPVPKQRRRRHGK